MPSNFDLQQYHKDNPGMYGNVDAVLTAESPCPNCSQVGMKQYPFGFHCENCGWYGTPWAISGPNVEGGPFSRTAAGEGATFYGAGIGTSGIAEGVAFRPDRQTREEFAAIGDAPYICTADRVIEEHDWALHGNLQGIVAEAGGANSHGALVAREKNIPCVVNAAGVANINPGDQVWVDSDQGEIRVNGGGVGGWEGEGDPVKVFAWFNHSFCVSDVGGQNHEEMIRYMTSFGLWGAMGTLGTLYDNGYAQVDQLPPGEEALSLGKMLSAASGTAPPEIGVAAPTRGKREPAPGTAKPQVPMKAAIDLYRWIWAPDHLDARDVDPNDINANSHLEMIAEYNADRGIVDPWSDMNSFEMQQMTGLAAMGIVYDSGMSEVYTASGAVAEGDRMEAEVQAALPSVTEFKYMTGGAPGVGGPVAKVAAEPNQKAQACPKCGSHTLRGEGLNGEDPKLHCLACKNIFSPKDLTSETGNKVVANKMAKSNESQVVDDAIELWAESGEPVGRARDFLEQTIREWQVDSLTHPINPNVVRQLFAQEIRLWANSRTSAKLEKGQRVEITHQALKGQRGTILEHSGKDENFDEELYNILLDNGEELEDVADSDFKKIKSASADPHFLWDEGEIEKEAGPLDGIRNYIQDVTQRGNRPTPSSRFICPECGEALLNIKKQDKQTGEYLGYVYNCPNGHGPYDVRYEELPTNDGYMIQQGQPIRRAGTARPLPEDILDGIDGGKLGVGYEGHPVMCYMCGNERTSSLGSRCGTCGYVLTIRRDGPPGKDAPGWKTSAVLMSDGVVRIYSIASTVDAGVQTHHLTRDGAAETFCGESVADMFMPVHSHALKNKPCYACFNPRVAGIKLADDDGLDLETGRWYTMYSENYPVPDVIQIIEIAEDQTITAHIEGDDKGVFPMAITPEERARNNYRFERYEKSAAYGDPQFCKLCGAPVRYDGENFICTKCGHNWGPSGQATEDLGPYNYTQIQSAADPACPECGDRLEGRVGSVMECSNCGWQGKTGPATKFARRNFSVTEQNELINENLGARARNFDKVNIDGTHYDPELLNEDSKEAYFTFGPDDPIGRHFLW